MIKKEAISRKLRIYIIIIITIFILTSNLLLVRTKESKANKTLNDEEIKENLAKFKGFFSKNYGQLENDNIYFVYPSNNIHFEFLESSVIMKVHKKLDNNTIKSSVIKLNYEGSNKVVPIGKEELIPKCNYFIGNDKSKWKRNALNYKKIVYDNIYDGIDLIYYCNENGLKYDWIIKPGADPTQIIVRFDEADSITLDSSGALIVRTETGEIKEDNPYSYQKICDDSFKVDVNYRLIGNNRLTYEIGKYKISEDLIIDPMIYSTRVGGGSFDYGLAIALDSEKNAYITGQTQSFSFPITTGCFMNSHNGGLNDVFVLKLNSDGSDLDYCTFIGGSDSDEGYDIILDSQNNAYITGQTDSSDFPITSGCFDDSFNGERDVFVLKLSYDGSHLEYSTFIGGESNDQSKGIAIDYLNNIYITGSTDSLDFPTTPRSFDDSHNGYRDVFIFKLNFKGTSLLYSTFVGGNYSDNSNSIVLDSENNAYITGSTNSLDFPITTNCYEESHNGKSDVFVCKLNAKGSDLIYSTFIGGSGSDSGMSITLDSVYDAYVTGDSNSSDFPTTQGCFDDSFNSWEESEVFVFKLNSDGSDLIYSTLTYHGTGKSIVIDSENNVYVTGFAKYFSDYSYWSSDTGIFILKLNHNGSSRLYSNTIGKGEGYDIAIDTDNNIYVTGYTSSEDFPATSGCFDDSYNGLGSNIADVIAFKYNPKEKGKERFKLIYITPFIVINTAIIWVLYSTKGMERKNKSKLKKE